MRKNAQSNLGAMNATVQIIFLQPVLLENPICYGLFLLPEKGQAELLDWQVF